jgi:hypothetical protein
MSVTLINRFESLVLEWDEWKSLYDFGRESGWSPAGTFNNPGEPIPNWDGNYFSNDGQWVRAADADAWAHALYKGQPKLWMLLLRESLLFRRTRHPGALRTAAFIRYCRMGEFQILSVDPRDDGSQPEGSAPQEGVPRLA